PHRKPGLWETTSTMKYTKGGPQIPPEQLAQMRQLGMKIPGMGGEPVVFKQCLTAEQAAKEERPETQPNSECQMQNQSWSGNTYTGDMVCHPRGGGEMHGHFTGTMNSDTSYSGSSTLTGSDPHMGGDYAMEQTSSAKWLGADCGTVAPGKFQLGK